MDVDYEANPNQNGLHEFFNRDFSENLQSLANKKICPYYYNFNLLKNSDPDIVVCTYKDFYDVKSRINISKLVPKESKIIFDECGDMDNIFTQLFSCNIDEPLLFNCINQLFLLREKSESYEEAKIKITMRSNEETKSMKAYHTEKEFISYNGLANFEQLESKSK